MEKLDEVQRALAVLYDALTPAPQRYEAEQFLTRASVECVPFAAAALQQQHVSRDHRLAWFLVAALDKHLERQYWRLGQQEDKDRLKQVRARPAEVAEYRRSRASCCLWCRDPKAAVLRAQRARKRVVVTQ